MKKKLPFSLKFIIFLLSTLYSLMVCGLAMGIAWLLDCSFYPTICILLVIHTIFIVYKEAVAWTKLELFLEGKQK